MLKPINLTSLAQAKNKLSKKGFQNFIDHHSIELKDREAEDLTTLVATLTASGATSANLDEFYSGYKIPQISKEFDLLRFGANYHINIELKSQSTVEKIKKQLIRNKYYLKFIGRPVRHFTFVSSACAIYEIMSDDTLQEVTADTLFQAIGEQKVEAQRNVDDLFNPSNYLVSPFNSTETFLEGEYFLTNQQEEFKGKILKAIKASKSGSVVSLTGGAGTGKTLLAYDIAKEFINSGRLVGIFHCGQLNNGHRRLIQNGWQIQSVKYLQKSNLSKFDLILIDEAQRLYKNQIDHISNEVSKNNLNFMFSYDRLQTLSTQEEKVDSGSKIKSLSNGNSFNLSHKIRSNKEVANFLKSLLDMRENHKGATHGNVQIRYFSSNQDILNFLPSLEENNWKVLQFTPSQYNTEFHDRYSMDNSETSHEVIGQEFDNVAVVIDKFFSYNKDGLLYYKGNSYYSASKMLFQNITRARKRIMIIIHGNEEILERCISIC